MALQDQLSLRQLKQSEEVSDWDDEEDRKPRYNPFDDDIAASFEVVDSSTTWVSQKEVADFMKQSGALSSPVSDDKGGDEVLGEPWGGASFSITQDRPRSGSGTKSARTRPQASHEFSKSLPTKKQAPPSEGHKKQPPPKRPPQPTSSMRSAASVSSSLPSSLSSSSSQVSAAAIRNQTAVVATTQAASQSSISASSSISDVISNTPQVSVAEYNKAQAEIRQLRKDLQAARKDKTVVPSVQETVKRIIRGQPYTLEVYKTLQDKLLLLNCAIKMHDGNAITAAVLFLKRTVKRGILHDELRTRPQALHHLAKYLKEHYDYTELTELYRSVGEYEKAAMLQFNQAIKTKDPGVRLTKLKYILRHYFKDFPQLAEQTNYLEEYIELLECQLDIEDKDSRAELEKKNRAMVAHPRQAALPLCSVLITLYYCCRYHFEEPENISSSPLAIRTKFKLTDKQYEWTALSARAKLKQWTGLEQMFRAKGWFGSVKMKSAIGFKQVVESLHQHGAPEKVLSTYLNLIDDLKERLAIATKINCHNVAIETLVAMKDRQQLEQYRGHLKGTAPEQAKISEYLNNSQIKWKH
ncbi:spermatogenesis-defective protein 39 homolog isoform X1 [Montipora capricornis]|uniref:spermatogenesis-defective protein 39 homolog isoform X1 n=1 Tax=Montipora capricornis TaxID=246305 RepID=UPI0035F1A4E6